MSCAENTNAPISQWMPAQSSRRPWRDSINFPTRNWAACHGRDYLGIGLPNKLSNGFIGSFAGDCAEGASGGIGAFATLNVRYAGAEGGYGNAPVEREVLSSRDWGAFALTRLVDVEGMVVFSFSENSLYGFG